MAGLVTSVDDYIKYLNSSGNIQNTNELVGILRVILHLNSLVEANDPNKAEIEASISHAIGNMIINIDSININQLGIGAELGSIAGFLNSYNTLSKITEPKIEYFYVSGKKIPTEFVFPYVIEIGGDYNWMLTHHENGMRYERSHVPVKVGFDEESVHSAELQEKGDGKRFRRKSRKMTNKRRKMKRRTKHYRPNNL